MLDLMIKNLKKTYFSDPVFEDLNMEINKGEKVGILGENGTGKTTLFRIIEGSETQTLGDVFIRKGLKIGYLKQMPSEYEGLSVRLVLLDAFKALNALHDEMRALERKMAESPSDLERILSLYSETQVKYEALGGYDIFEKMSKICEGLRFSDDMLSKDYSVLSGGEKTRVELGKQLLENPDILLLDEPTNHLDIETTEWLEGFLKTYEGSVLIISHDRYFLDRVIDRIYEIKLGRTETYLGNYSYYLEERTVRYDNQLRHYNAQQRKIKQMEEAAKRMRDWAQRADNESMFIRAKAMEKRIERVDPIERPVKDTRSINVTFESQGRSAKEVIRLKDYDITIGDITLVQNVDFTVWYQDHVALIGANGTGKSTMIKQILSAIHEDNPSVKVGSRVSIGYLEQDIHFDNPELTLVETYKTYYPEADGKIRNELAGFKFYQEDVFKKVKNLSGGEKVRLMLAILMRQDINCLVLDEPTNHIDIKTKEVLEETLESFEGTIFFITHDRYFLNKMANRIFEIEDKKLFTYEGNYEAYKNEKLKRQETQSTSSKENQMKTSIMKPQEIKQEEAKPQEAKTHEAQAHEDKNKAKRRNAFKINQMENQIEDLENAIALHQASLHDKENDYVHLQETLKTIGDLEQALETAMEAYYAYLD